MKSNFAIAYCDKDGKDFNGVPWILDDISNKKECILKTLEMIEEGFTNVVPFQFDDERKNNIEEEFTWEYVMQNKVFMEEQYNE